MSKSWGPRAHPERCDEWPPRDRKDRTPMRTGEQILTVIVMFTLVMGAVVWLTRGWGW